MILTTTEGEANLPRYFARVFAMSQSMNNGRVDFVLLYRLFFAETYWLICNLSYLLDTQGI